MAARFLITRILLVLLLSELDYSSAFPRAWQGEMKKGHGYGNRRPLQYIRSLRQPHQNLQPNVHDQVQVRAWQRPKARVYQQTQSPHQPWSDVATTGTQEVSPSQHPSQRDYPPIRPRSFEFNLKIPFVELFGQKKETSSNNKGPDLSSGGSDGAGRDSQSYRPTSVQINSAFSSASGSDGLSGKGPTNDPNGGKGAHDVSKPSFQLSLSVPIPPTTPSPKPASSHGDHLANLKRPESVGFVQNSYMEPAQPQSSSTQSGAERIFSNVAIGVQQQTQHQMFEPVQTKYTDSTQMNFLPGHTSQHTTPISQVKIPAKQSLVFPELSAPSLPNSQYLPLQSDNVNSGYYSAQINPLSNDYGKAQSETVSSDQTNVHLSLFPSHYERVQSGQYSAGQVKPSGNNYGQSQIWQPVSTPPTFASEQCNDGQFKPSFGQNVETVPYMSPVYPSSPTVAPSQYELPSSHQVATTNYYGTGNVAQMVPTDFSSSYYQDNRYQSGQEALPAPVAAPSPNFQSPSTDYQTQMRLPGQYNDRGQMNGKPKYTQLFIDDDDVMYQYASNPHY